MTLSVRDGLGFPDPRGPNKCEARESGSHSDRHNLQLSTNGANHAVVVHGAIFWAVNSITSDTKRVTCPAAGRGGVAGKESGGCEVYRASKAALNTMMRSVGRASGGASDQQAHAHCPSNTVVWVNTRSRIHHRLLAATALACRCRRIGAVFLSNWRPSGISVELYFGTAGSMFAPKTV
jgi:NAD(P)-dependent dehydrogenase (short-subunit alcohol dehydrogenase family)